MIKEIIQSGEVVDYRNNWKGRGYDTAVIAAPILIGEDEYIAGVVVERSNSSNLFYVHEVFTRKNGAMPFKTGTQKMGTPSGDAPSVYNLLHRIWDVKDGSVKKRQYSISPVGKVAEQAQEQKEKTVRANLDEEGHKKTPPNLGDEDTVFSEGNKMYSISREEDKEYLDAVKVGKKVKADISAAGEKDKEPEKTQKTETQSYLSWMGGSTGNAELDRIIRLR